MNRKKSKKADLEWRKSTFFQLGIVISLSLVLMAFEFVRSDGRSGLIDIGIIETPTDIVVIQTTHEPELPKPKLFIPISNIDVVDNNKLVESIFVDAGIEPEEAVPEYTPVIEKPEEIVAPEVPFVAVEIMPEFPGGYSELVKFLHENIVYPKIARETKISGKVMVNFVVEPDGSLSNINITRSASPYLDEEAVRVVKMMPKWEPGRQRQKTVRVSYNLPIDFILQ